MEKRHNNNSKSLCIKNIKEEIELKVDLKYILKMFEEYNVPTGIANYMSKTEQLNDIPKGIRIIREK